ncbi:hypothetical protein ScPMuIL_004081 [Solemya velum]
MWKSSLFLALTVCLIMSHQSEALLSQYEKKDNSDLTMLFLLMMMMNNQQQQQQPMSRIIYAPVPSYGHNVGYGGGMFGGYGFGYGGMY